MFIKNQRLAVLALGMMPLIITVGCIGKLGKQSEQEQIAELETKLAALKGGGTTPDQESAPVIVPQGTRLTVSLSSGLTTDTHHTGDSWNGQLSNDVEVDDMTIWKAGTRVSGTVTASAPSGRLSSAKGILSIKLMQVGDMGVEGSVCSAKGEDKTARNTKIIGTSTGLGAVTGILSNKKHKSDHALGGAVVGAAVGTAVAAGTANTVIRMPSKVTFRLLSDVSVMVND